MVTDTDCKCGTAPAGRVFALSGRPLCAECALEAATRVLIEGWARDPEWSEALTILGEVPSLLDGERQEMKARAEEARQRNNRETEKRTRLLIAEIRSIAGLPVDPTQPRVIP